MAIRIPWLSHVWPLYVCFMHGYSTREYIPCVAHDKLLETCMFHATRKRDPRKHVTGLFKVYRVTTRVHACKNEVIIERYCMYVSIYCVIYRKLLYTIGIEDHRITL